MEDGIAELSKDLEYKYLMESIDASVSKHLLDEHFTLVAANQRYYEMFGYEQKEYEDCFHNRPDLFFKQDLDEWNHLNQHVLKAIQNGEKRYMTICRMRHKDGRKLWIRLVGTFTNEYVNGYQISYSVMMDITSLMQTRIEKDVTENHFPGLISKYRITKDGFQYLDGNKNYLDYFHGINVNYFHLTDMTPENGLEEIKKMYPCLRNGENTKLTISYKNPEGERSYFNISAQCVDWIEDDPIYLLIYSDITEIVVQKELLEKYNQYLNELAYLDDVTKGFNQRKFDIVARETIEKAQPYEYVMIWLNVQKFKVINEIGGFDLGNQTLKYVYSEIRNHLLDNEYVARMFSDNFAILMLYDNQQKLEYRLNRCFEDINDYESNSDYKFRFSFTTGIYLIDETDIPITQIKDRAHAARKLVSPQDNDLCVYHYYDNTIRIQMLNEKDIENRAYLALQNGEFEVYFQPKYSVKKHQLSGAEALVRWNHPTRGFLSPAEFIPVFENNGFITHVDLFVFQTVCQMIRKRLDAHQAVVPVSINMSRMHFSHPHFLNEYIKIRNKYNIPFKYLELELTESIVFENIEMFINIIKSIHQAGFMCSMDDFGSGYSSLSMLKNLEVDTIKLDKSFFATKDMSYEKEKIIVKNIIDMAKALNISTVAEGIETHEQVNFLEHTECDLIQGFVYSRPIPIQNFNDLLDSQL